MATFLYRVGGWAFRRRRRVLMAWILVVGLVGAAAATFSGQTDNSFVVPGTESQRAQDLLEAKFPGAGGASARVVFKAPEGESLTDPAHRAAVMASVEQARHAEDVTGVVDPYQAKALTADGRVGFADVIYPEPAGKISEEARDELAAVAGPARAEGLQVEFGGGLVDDAKEAGSESAGMMVAFVVLAITLGSLLAAGLPLITAIFGVAIGVTGLTALSGAMEISETAPILATMLGLAVGIDYALFILARHRQNLGDGMTVEESAAQATATAGGAVVFAGATVVIALVGLTVVNIPFLTVMGLAAAATVTVAVLVALTLLPALLGFMGERITRVNRLLGYGRSRAGRRDPVSLRWVRFVARRPVAVLAVGLGLMGVVALPALHMKLGLPDGGSSPTSTTERRAYDILTDAFGPGFNGQLTVVVDAPGVAQADQKQFAHAVAKDLGEFPGVAAASAPIQNPKGDLTIVLVTPETSPASDETRDLVMALRDRADRIPADAGIQGLVTGTTALNIDTADRLSAALPRYVLVVVGLALILLTIVFRSLYVPIKAALGFLLSIAASMGVVVWIFQDGNLADVFNVAQPGPVLSFLPVLLIGILFGLAMDYEVFLVSRMREHFVHTGKAKEAVVTGYAQSGRVVIAAATIMIAVFAAFILDPSPITKSIGLSLAFGVLVDAFVVRLTLVPAVMTLLGKRAWALPRRVDRFLPDVDIEGERLAARLHPTPAT
jgi:putative drug exporter of the RND superfamily